MKKQYFSKLYNRWIDFTVDDLAHELELKEYQYKTREVMDDIKGYIPKTRKEAKLTDTFYK